MKPIVALAVAVWAYLVLTFHPGLVNHDTFVWLREATTAKFQDWHPPFWALVWRGLTFTSLGYKAFFTLQAAVVAAGLTYSAWALFKGLPARAALVCAALAHPVLFGYWPLIGKDVPGAVSLLVFHVAVIALIRPVWAPVGEERSPRAAHVAAAGLSLVLGVLSRHELTFVLAPAGALLAATLIHEAIPRLRPTLSARLRIGAAVAALPLGAGAVVALALASKVIVEGVTHAAPRYPWQAIMAHDLAADVVAGVPEPILAEFDQDGDYKPEDIVKAYSPNLSDSIMSGTAPLYPSWNEATVARLRQAWIDQKLQHPGIYLAHRWAVTKSMLSIGIKNPKYFSSNYARVVDNNARANEMWGKSKGIPDHMNFVLDSPPPGWAVAYARWAESNQEGAPWSQGWFHALWILVFAVLGSIAALLPLVRRRAPAAAGHAFAAAVLGWGALGHVVVLAFASPGYVPRYLMPEMLVLTGCFALAAAAGARYLKPAVKLAWRAGGQASRYVRTLASVPRLTRE